MTPQEAAQYVLDNADLNDVNKPCLCEEQFDESYMSDEMSRAVSVLRSFSAQIASSNHIGACESCDALIHEGQPHHHCTEGALLCEDHAPMMSDVLTQYEQMLAEQPFSSGDLDMTEGQLRETAEMLKAVIETNGDRKVLH